MGQARSYEEPGPLGGPTPRSPWRDRMLVAIVPLLLIAFACVGTWRYHALDQTSWRGGSLGMFATIDGSSNRLVRGVLHDGEVVLVPASIGDEGERARVTPTPDNLRRLADAWSGAEHGSDLARIEVFRTEFDPDGPSIELGLMRTHLVARDG